MLASGTVKKVIEINPYLLGTMAGGAGESFPCAILDLSHVDSMLGRFLQRIVNIGKRISGFRADSTS